MEYWTIINDRHAGPFSATQLVEMGITANSPVWTAGLPDWVEAAEIEELRLLLSAPEPIQQIEVEVEPAQQLDVEVEPIPQVEAEPTQQPYPEQPYHQPYQGQWQAAPAPGEPCPPAYLVWAVIVTILCCIPLGIGAVICSAQTKQAYRQGNLLKAKKMSDYAQWFIILSIVLGLLSMPIQLAFAGF